MSSRVAAIQMCSSNSVAENLENAQKLIAEAATNNAKLIVLPEMFAFMGNSDATKLEVKEHFGDGEIQSFLSNQAQENRIWLVGGTIPIQSNIENKVKAACLMFNDKGSCVARYDKIHLFDVRLSEKDIYQESAITDPGDKAIVIVSPFG